MRYNIWSITHCCCRRVSQSRWSHNRSWTSPGRLSPVGMRLAVFDGRINQVPTQNIAHLIGKFAGRFGVSEKFSSCGQYLTFIYLFKCILSYFYLTSHQLISIFYRNFNISNLFYFIMILYSAMSNDAVGMALYKN